MEPMRITFNGQERTVADDATGQDLVGDDRSIVVVRVDGELVDLDQPLPAGAVVEPVAVDSPDGLNVLRHSAAHVMAQAVQDLHPDAKLGKADHLRQPRPHRSQGLGRPVSRPPRAVDEVHPTERLQSDAIVRGVLAR
jgi:sulfur carrier protein ThiS